ncbi:MAG: hypothetical protein RLZZ543_1827 [Bacteroidota bacterium]|jgi:hypothetical protein
MRATTFLRLLIPLCIVPMLLGMSHFSKPAELEKISIADRLKSGRISIELTSLGGHQNKCVELKLLNRSADSTLVLLEAGRKLIADDSSMQDILVVREELIHLAPHQEKRLAVTGFCCRAHRKSPASKSQFQLGPMAPNAWVEVAAHISRSNYPSYAIQSAVWALSDNHSIAAISTSEKGGNNPLRSLVAKVKNLPLPWYSIEYEPDTSRLFSNKPQRVWGEIEYYVPNNGQVTLVIKDAKGRNIRTLINAQNVNPGTYTYFVDEPLKGWKNGTYTLMLYGDQGNLILRRDFSV